MFTPPEAFKLPHLKTKVLVSQFGSKLEHQRHRTILPLMAWLTAFFLVLSPSIFAAQAPQKTLRVAIKPLTPFVMTAASGVDYEGFSIDLWNAIAAKNGWAMAIEIISSL